MDDEHSRTAIAAANLALLLAACGPDLDEGPPPGVLEYEHPASQLYRLDRRVEIVALDPTVSTDECGFLTEGAHRDLVSTIDALDRSVDYGYGAEDCPDDFVPKGLVHLEGFAHSPFACELSCCHPDLIQVARVYFAVENGFAHAEVNIEGEPYVALEPDRPCP